MVWMLSWFSLCRTYILPEDLEHFLEPEKAQQAFDILDVDGDGQVTLHNIRDAVVSIYQVGELLIRWHALPPCRAQNRKCKKPLTEPSP